MAPTAAAAAGRSIKAGGSVAVRARRRALVQLRLAKASLKPALSSATRVEGPLNNVQNNSFVLVPRLHNNLRGILQNPDRESLTQYGEFIR